MDAVTLTADMPIMLTSAFRQRVDRGERLVRVRSMPRTVFVDAHERQSQENHRQTLARIRERGGFDATEMVAVLSCLPYQKIDGLSEEAAHRILYAFTSTHNRGMRIAEAAAPTRAESAPVAPPSPAGSDGWREADGEVVKALASLRREDGMAAAERVIGVYRARIVEQMAMVADQETAIWDATKHLEAAAACREIAAAIRSTPPVAPRG